MRVLHATPYFAPAFRYGGPPQSVLGLCQGLQHAGVSVEVFTTTANGGEPLPPRPEGATYDGVRARYFPLAFPKRYWRAAGLGRALAEAAADADVIHIHGLWNATTWMAVRAARSAGRPYVISPRGMLQPAARMERRLLKTIAFAAIERRHLRGAAFLHATSADEAEVLAPFGRPVTLIPNGVTPRAAAAIDAQRVRRTLDVPDDATVVLYLGRLHPIKRLDLLADAFTQLRGAVPNAYLVIAGADEGGHRRLIEPAFHDVRERVRWAGPLNDVEKWAWLSASRALVQCSDTESFGMSVAEALTAGLPVVVTERSPWRDLEAAGCGLVVPHTGPAIAAALERLCSDASSASSMAHKARAFAAARFNWDELGSRMALAYEDALDRAGTAAHLRGFTAAAREA